MEFSSGRTKPNHVHLNNNQTDLCDIYDHSTILIVSDKVHKKYSKQMKKLLLLTIMTKFDFHRIPISTSKISLGFKLYHHEPFQNQAPDYLRHKPNYNRYYKHLYKLTLILTKYTRVNLKLNIKTTQFCDNLSKTHLIL